MSLELTIGILIGTSLGVLIQAALDRRLIRRAFDDGLLARRVREWGGRR